MLNNFLTRVYLLNIHYQATSLNNTGKKNNISFLHSTLKLQKNPTRNLGNNSQEILDTRSHN